MLNFQNPLCASRPSRRRAAADGTTQVLLLKKPNRDAIRMEPVSAQRQRKDRVVIYRRCQGHIQIFKFGRTHYGLCLGGSLRLNYKTFLRSYEEQPRCDFWRNSK